MDALPQGMEKRLVLRLLQVWRKACDDDVYPSSARMEAERIDDIWDHCFVLDLTGPDDRPIFRQAGPCYAAHAGIPLNDLPIADAPEASLVANSLCCLDEVLRKRVPVSRGGTFRDASGAEILFRTILLPLSDDGKPSPA
jgi:hypothetical protein